MVKAIKCFRKVSEERAYILCQWIYTIFQSLILSNIEHRILSSIHTDASRISGLDMDVSDFAKTAHRFCLSLEEYLWLYS